MGEFTEALIIIDMQRVLRGTPDTIGLRGNIPSLVSIAKRWMEGKGI